MRWFLAAALAALGPAAVAADAPAGRAAELTLGYERVRLPDDETMGLLGVRYLVEAAPGWWLGPALFGAASGSRGGLFTWGVEGQRQWALGGRWRAAAGLYVGGGGGANAPVGGGLMLRPHADLLADFGGWSAGVSLSQVRFPNGRIEGHQIGLLFSLPDRFGAGAASSADALIRVDRLGLALGRYGSGAVPAFSTVGLRAEQQLSPRWSASVEGIAAASGSADGYAEFDAGLAALWPLGSERWQLGGRAALGLAGGGGVPTGGGTVAKLALLTRLQLGEAWAFELEAGRAHSFGGRFDVRYAQAALSRAYGGGVNGSGGTEAAWGVSVQRYARAQRRAGGDPSLTTLGLKFERALGEHLYATAQAFGAVTGGAGAYSVGLLGLGAAAGRGGWRAGAEALAGAAGGGGVSSHGGAVVQPQLWAEREVDGANRIRLGVGYIKSVKGELASPLLDLTWTVAFGGR